MITDEKVQELIKAIRNADDDITTAARKQDNPRIEIRERKSSERLKRRLNNGSY